MKAMTETTSIKMVDLWKQYLRIKPEIDAAFQDIFISTAFVNSPVIKEFEKQFAAYLGVKHVISCGNGTDAIQIALMSLGLEKGDEIIVPAFTFVATAEAVALLGLKPVFVDVHPDTFNIDPEKIEAAVTHRTKGIIPVHLFGQCADMENILSLARKHNFSVIEDNAQATGGEYYFSDGKKAKSGTIGDIGCTSFFPTKNLACYGDGGALFTNDDVLAERIRMIANHGWKKRYYSEKIGVNSRLDSLQAAALIVKLKYLDEFNHARKVAADRYDSFFSSEKRISIPYRDKKSSHVFHQYTLKILEGTRTELKIKLEEKGIPSMIYFPVPLHLLKPYQSLGYRTGDFPVSEELCYAVISLPMHTELTEEQIRLISRNLLEML